jgi:CRISPR-associated protein Cas1
MVQYTPVLSKKQVAAYHLAKSTCQDLLAEISDSSVLVLGGYGENLTTRSKQGIKILLLTRGEDRVEFFPGKHGLEKVIWQTMGSLPRENAIAWMNKEKISYSIFDADGKIISTNQETEFQNDDLLTKQLNLFDSQKVSYAREIISQKVSGQISVLSQFSGQLRNGHGIASEMEDMLPDSSQVQYSYNQQAVMLFEGREAGLYFSAWRGMQVPWATGENDLKQYNIYPGRSEGAKDGNKTACDPINSMLNFGYFTLENRLLTAIKHAGLSSQASFLHAPLPKRHNLIFDLIEVLRPKVDAAILKFLKSYKLQWSYFNVSNGHFTLMHAFARVLTALIEREISDKDIQAVIEHYVAYLSGSIALEPMPSAIGRKLDLPSYKSNRQNVKRGPSKKTLAFREIKDREFSEQIADRIARDSA